VTAQNQAIAFLHITLSSHASNDLDAFKQIVLSLDSVTQIYHVSGPTDYIIRVETADNSSLECIINQLTEIITLQRVQASIVYSQLK
jgi:DNA-binding Lrp family transcriptional regulator